MADKPLIFYSFLLEKQTDSDATKSNPDPLGFFYARASTVRFFDIAALAQAAYKKTRKGYVRVNTLADGTNLSGGASINVDAHPVTFSAKTRPQGGRRAILVTGKATSSNIVTKKTNYHTVSFNFPQWADVFTISDVLGTLLPEAKVKNDPGANDVWPYFILGSGKKYPIMEKAAATAATGANVAMTDQQAQEMATKKQATIIKPKK
ncbi:MULTISPECIES: hypothetical protein [unclassified Nodularia (in: cyanobacteria)]|uniref:hypothetical protein n=1 Tax=unclassified Nodularia (in: cyanobacteria) TaxID=2656917 RepID=UPI00187E71F9|nr:MULTISPECIES: hypothetical protein [unclassified Nodularia (in: cyanobacteria)]MBE9199084.1 hypothetical protein [Nodularia sp. LEGE 06071]MCC2695771.1 hypothetical protein [Nodularia sp. LEGE 04288]